MGPRRRAVIDGCDNFALAKGLCITKQRLLVNYASTRDVPIKQRAELSAFIKTAVMKGCTNNVVHLREGSAAQAWGKEVNLSAMRDALTKSSGGFCIRHGAKRTHET